MKNKLAVFLTAVLMSFSTHTLAFEGFSIGASYSSLDFSTSGYETAAGDVAGVTNALEKNSTTKTGSGDLGSIFAEYTFAQGSTIGIEHISGSATLGSGTRTQTSAGGGGATGTVSVKAEISDPTTFYVEPTYMFNDSFGLYLKGGATRVTIEPKEVSDTTPLVASTYKNQDVWGIMTGIGAKAYYNNFFIKAEYVETEFESYSYQSTTGNKNSITADVDTEETRFSIGYNF
jgi:hypothetical protein